MDYHLIGDPFIIKRDPKIIKTKRKVKYIILTLLFIIFILEVLISTGYINVNDDKEEIINDNIKMDIKKFFTKNEIKSIDNKMVFIKGDSRFDEYGVDLNVNILDGIYCFGYNGKSNEIIDKVNIYTPPCPNLRPIHYPDEIINPICEKSSLQIENFEDKSGKNLPFNLKLDNITNQINKWNSWKKDHVPDINYYKNKKVVDLVKNEYHPFDYGDNIKFEDIESDKNFYKNVVKSRMDEIPDPRRRRLFSFIIFDTEFDLLDIYLAELYDIVDYFVIYESNRTFTGKEKPLYFTRTLLETDRYDKFKDKLIPLPSEISTNTKNKKGKLFWRENLARRVLIEKGLQAVHARHGDLYFHGDLDELPKAHILARMKRCGGWEHLQAGIGGGPSSFKVEDQIARGKKVESYFLNENKNEKINKVGKSKVPYNRINGIGFLSWFYEYSFNIVENPNIGSVAHPNLAIFDARKSLGQYNEYKHKKTVETENNNDSSEKVKNKNDDKRKDQKIKNDDDDYVKKSQKKKNGDNYGKKNKMKKNMGKKHRGDDKNDEIAKLNRRENLLNENIKSTKNKNADITETENKPAQINNFKKLNINANESANENANASSNENINVNTNANTKSTENVKFHSNINSIINGNSTESNTVTKNENNHNINGNGNENNKDYFDPLNDPSFNPYHGYIYSKNASILKKGKDYLEEYNMRLETQASLSILKKHDKTLIWNGGWHMSSCFSTIDLFINKITTYSRFKNIANFKLKSQITSRIKNHLYIFGKKRKYYDNVPYLPESYDQGYKYNFDFDYWESNINNAKLNKTTEEFNKYLDHLYHEIPNQIWRNPICYSYMIDRDYGLDKKLWWQVIPKKEWNTVRFENLEKKIIDKILPKSIKKTFREKMLQLMKEEN